MECVINEIKDNSSIGLANSYIFLNPSVTKVMRDFFYLVKKNSKDIIICVL